MSANDGLTSGLITLLGGLGGTVLLLMPGYVLGAVYSRGIRGPAVSDRAFVAISALGGVTTHLVGLVLTVPLVRRITASGLDESVWLIAAWGTIVLLILPALLGGLLGILGEGRIPLTDREAPSWLMSLLGNLGLTVSVRTQEAWNWVFHHRIGAWVRVHLKDGEGLVLGKFGKDSFASSDAMLRDIYIEELWVHDEEGWFVEPYPTSSGIWISGDEIAAIEFFEGEEDESPREGVSDVG